MSEKDKVKKFLNDKGLKFSSRDTHYQLDCFLCTDKRERLGIDKESGAWKCFNCSSGGKKLNSLIYAYNHKGTITTKDKIELTEREKKCTIKPNFHLQWQKRLKNTKKYASAKYLVRERGLSKETVLHFKLGARKIFKNKDGEKFDAGEHVAIPYIQDDKCVCVKYRSLDPEIDKKWKWRREKGGISTLFNDAVIDDFDYDEIFITESEIDTMSFWSFGIKNVVGLTTGAEGFHQSWYDRLERFKKVYLVLDNDIKGQEGAEKIAKRLGKGRCFNIVLPEGIKDPNDYIQKYTKEDLFKLAKKAPQFKVRGARSLRDMMGNLYNKRFNEDEEEIEGFKTPWKKVNNIIGPLKPGHLFVLAGKPKSGKSSLALNLMEHWGNQDIGCGMYSCEMNELRIAEKFTMMKIPTVDKIENIEPIQVKEAMFKLPMDKMEFYYPDRADLTGDKEAIDRVCQKITEIVQRYGLKIFVFDNLHFLCRGDDDKAMIDAATQQFKLLAEELGILFILVTHPRKTNSNKQLKTDDLKGSSSIFQDADVVWLMHRPYNDADMIPEEAGIGVVEGAMSPRTDISITGRWTEGGKTFLAFHGAQSLFKDKGTLYNEVAKQLGQGKKKKTRGM